MKHLPLVISIAATSILSLTACSSNTRPFDANELRTTPTLQQQKAHTQNANHNLPKKTAHNGKHKKKPASHKLWSYEDHNGPDVWGMVEGSETCAIGAEQSPINIERVTSASTVNNATHMPVINYTALSNVTVHDNGHTIVFTPNTDTNYTMINGERYDLKQFHYHMPSEHQIVGQHYPGELHFVHANAKGNLAVIGMMLQPGQSNDTMQVLLNGTGLTLKNDVEFTANNVDLRTLIAPAKTFYHYDGSLTTPPCTEQVQWYVAKQPLDLGNDQLAMMYDLYNKNNRPALPQGDRVVEVLGE